MQNWNEGKLQEFKDRTTYDVRHSKLKHGVSRLHTEEAAPAPAEERREGGLRKRPQLYLFTTKTCPNCRTAKEFLSDLDYQIIDAEEHPELAERFGIMQAPTLVMVDEGIVRKFANASNIRRFAEQNRAEGIGAALK